MDHHLQIQILRPDSDGPRLCAYLPQVSKMKFRGDTGKNCFFNSLGVIRILLNCKIDRTNFYRKRMQSNEPDMRNIPHNKIFWTIVVRNRPKTKNKLSPPLFAYEKQGLRN